MKCVSGLTAAWRACVPDAISPGSGNLLEGSHFGLVSAEFLQNKYKQITFRDHFISFFLRIQIFFLMRLKFVLIVRIFPEFCIRPQIPKFWWNFKIVNFYWKYFFLFSDQDVSLMLTICTWTFFLVLRALWRAGSLDVGWFLLQTAASTTWPPSFWWP